MIVFYLGESRALASIGIEGKPYRGEKTANIGDKCKNTKNQGKGRRENSLSVI